MITEIQNNLPAIGGILTAVGAILHSAYVIVGGAGGFKGIARKIMNGADKP